jgi:hypothetical protein
MEEAARLWRIVQLIRSGVQPPRAMQPQMTDTIFVRLMLEVAQNQDRFVRCISSKEALLRWSQNKTNAQLMYLIWLQRARLVA